MSLPTSAGSSAANELTHMLLCRLRALLTPPPLPPLSPPTTAEPAASGAAQEPSPAAPSHSTSGGDGSPMRDTQASSESASSGNRTSSGAGADETTPTDQGVAPGVPVSSGKAKAKKISLSAVYKVTCVHLMSLSKPNSAAAQTCLV